MGDHGGPARGFAPSAKQSDGRKPLPHLITALASVFASLALAHFAHLGGTGPAGPAGAAGKTATNAGICAYFGPAADGHNRFQVSTPAADGSCSKGVFVSVSPGK